MARRTSNRQRNAWTVELLDIAPDDRVLELGCGPGLAVADISKRLMGGRVIGIDHSFVMIEQARARNRSGLMGGRVTLDIGDIDHLPRVSGGFTKVFAVNVIQFLDDLDAASVALAAVMAPGGLMALTYQPRLANATRDSAEAFGDRLVNACQHAGLVDIRLEMLPMKPAPVVCVLGRKQGDFGKQPAV